MEDKDSLAWLALAQYLDGKKCAVCGHLYNSREAVKQHPPLEGFNGDVVGRVCWGKYIDIQARFKAA